MPSRSTASDYSSDDLLLVRRTCLYLFSGLPSRLTDHITVVGGLVPSLLIPQPAAHEGRQAIDILHSAFADVNGDGAIAVSVFLYGRQDEDVQADVAGFTARLLAFFGSSS